MLDIREVIVVGGGPAGFCAAVAAARAGADTQQVEQYGVLGGAMTVGGVPYPMMFAAGERRVIAGIGWELIKRLLDGGWARPNNCDKMPYGAVRVDPVMTACEMDAMACESGVDVLTGCKLASATAVDGRVLSADFAMPEGIGTLKARVWIDATGDGQLSALAGAAFEMGETGTGILQPGSYGFWMDGYNADEMDADALQSAYLDARKNGEIRVGDYYGEDTWPVIDMFKGNGLNKNHVDMPDITARARTDAAIEGRKRIRRIMNWAKRSAPGASGIYGAALCPEAWPRETRRILGRGYVSADAYRRAERYADAICFSYYPMDVHIHPCEGEKAFYLETHTLDPENVPSIPLSAMMVRGFDNLMTAGRCISGDRMAQSAYRVQATCMAMGHAAGVTAALNARGGGNLNDVVFEEAAEKLRGQGAIVPERLPTNSPKASGR